MKATGDNRTGQPLSSHCILIKTTVNVGYLWPVENFMNFQEERIVEHDLDEKCQV